jgi:hypothetical protein
MNFKVIEVRIINSGSLLAEVVCKYGDFEEIKGFMVFRNDKGAWVNWPSRAWEGKDGQRRFDQVVKPSNELRKAVDPIILQAVVDRFREDGISDEVPF